MASLARRRLSRSSSINLFFSAFICRFLLLSSFLLSIICCSIRPPFDWGRSHLTQLASCVSPSSSLFNTMPCLHTWGAGLGVVRPLNGCTLINIGLRGLGVPALVWRELEVLKFAEDCTAFLDCDQESDGCTISGDPLKVAFDFCFHTASSPRVREGSAVPWVGCGKGTLTVPRRGISWGSGVLRPGRRKCEDERSRSPLPLSGVSSLWFSFIWFSTDVVEIVCTEPREMVAIDVRSDRKEAGFSVSEEKSCGQSFSCKACGLWKCEVSTALLSVELGAV